MSELLKRARAIRGVCRRAGRGEHIEVFITDDSPPRIYAFVEGSEAAESMAKSVDRAMRLSNHSTVPQIHVALAQHLQQTRGWS